MLLCKVPYLIYSTFSTRIDLHLVSVCKNTFYADIGVTQLTKQEEDPKVPVKEKLELPVMFLACLLFSTRSVSVVEHPYLTGNPIALLEGLLRKVDLIFLQIIL